MIRVEQLALKTGAIATNHTIPLLGSNGDFQPTLFQGYKTKLLLLRCIVDWPQPLP
jgi:hypothetical protein